VFPSLHPSKDTLKRRLSVFKYVANPVFNILTIFFATTLMGSDTPNGTRPGTPLNNGTTTPNPAVATIHNLRRGCKVYAHKDDELRQAEILSIQIRQGEPHFYVHYKEYNKVYTHPPTIGDYLMS
jgi:hypothetical protein